MVAERHVRGDVHVEVDPFRGRGVARDDERLRGIVPLWGDEQRADVIERREADAHGEIVLEVLAQPSLLRDEGVALAAQLQLGSHTRSPSSRYSRSVARSRSFGSVRSRSRKMRSASGAPMNAARIARPSSTIVVTARSSSQPTIISAK